MTPILIFICNFFLAIAIGFAGTNRKMGFLGAFLWALFLGPLALFIIIGAKRKNPIGCKHCGNADNEANYCGLCFKNEAGETRKGFQSPDFTIEQLIDS